MSKPTKENATYGNYPVFRTGLVIQSNLDLSEDQANGGVLYLDQICSRFEFAIEAALKDGGAIEIEVLGPRPVEEDGPDVVGRGVRFRDVVFTQGKFTMEARAGVTICERHRQSKIAVRILCLEYEDGPAEALDAETIGTFFSVAESLIELLENATAATYTDALDAYVQTDPAIVTSDGKSLAIVRKAGFSTRTYDSTNEAIYDLIEELNDGEPLSEVLEQNDYLRLFQELWAVATEDTDAPVLEASEAVDALESDELTDLSIIEGAFVDDNFRERTEQRALIISRFAQGAGDIPRVTMTGISCPPRTTSIYNTDLRSSAAYRMSGKLFANFAQQF